MGSTTRHGSLTDEIREQAAMFALGMLDSSEAMLFEEHLRDGCDVCQSEVDSFRESAGRLAFGAPPAAPPSSLRMRLLEDLRPGPQVWKRWAEAALSDIHVVRQTEGAWESVGLPGVQVKRLLVDPATQSVTMLVRMEPGSEYPAHRHGGTEQCFVLEGDVEAGSVRLHAGDFQCCGEGFVHERTRTDGGCLLLIVSSQTDELLG